MKKQNRFLWPLLLGGALFLLVLAAFAAVPGASQAAPADLGNITLDGLKDSDYVVLATDPAGDLHPDLTWSGISWTDLTTMSVSADENNLYVYVDLPNYYDDPGDEGNDSTGQIGLVLEVDGQPNSGGPTDPWGNAIVLDYDNVDGYATEGTTLYPDYVIRGNIYNDGGDDGWTELREWNGNWDTGTGANWGGISGGDPVGSNIAYSFGNGVEFMIPLADIGNPEPWDVRLQFFAGQDGGSKGAYDTLPSDDQSQGWDDLTTQTNLAQVPLAIDPEGDLASPGPADWEGVAWTDLTQMRVWADHNSLQVFIPMSEYTPTVSSGQIGMAVNTMAGGGSSDPWGTATTFNYTATYQNLGATPVLHNDPILPDYLIRGNIFGSTPDDNGWTELREWNGNWDTGSGTDWGGIGNSGEPALANSNVSWLPGNGLFLRIPFADINVSAGEQVDLQFFALQTGGDKGAYDTVPADDQATGWSDPVTLQYLASYVIPDIGSGSAAHDNNIFWDDLGHNSRDALYRTPQGPVTTGTPITLRLRAASGDLTAARLRVWDDRPDAQLLLEMELVADDGTYEWWEATIPAGALPTIYWYRFIAIDGTATAYYEDHPERDGGWGLPYNESPDYGWQISVYDPAFQTPDWAKEAIIYQIFTDRFRDGGVPDPPAGRFFYGELDGTIYRSNSTEWNTVVCDPRDAADCPGTYSLNFYGGDLPGILEKLDYLESIGITALYLNPIFESPSNHKYDTTDFSEISRDFGDMDDFVALVDAAHSRGMHVILDGVFNHTSSDSVYFDRYSRYNAAGDLTSPGGPGTNDGSGACESETSPYRDWYYFTDVPAGTGECVGSDGTPEAATYESWFGFDSLPKLRATNQEVRDYFYDAGQDSIGQYWVTLPYTDSTGADGWRMDVGGDIDPGVTRDPSNDYWEEFRTAIRSVDPDAYLVIEEWGNASPWLLGNEMDATMNYQFSTAMLGFWRDTAFTDNDHNTGSSAGVIEPLSPSELNEQLLNWIERYPEPALYAMMNLLGSHDTNRPLFFLDHNAATSVDSEDDPNPLLDPNYDWSDPIERQKGVWLLQMTLPGAPTTYYGDEVGLVGPTYYSGGKWEDDPYNRQPFPWLDEGGTPFYTHLQTAAGQDQLRDFYTLLTSARNSHPALQTGSFDPLLVDDANQVYAYGRLLDDYSDAAVVILNRAGTIEGGGITQTVTVDVSGYLPVGATFTEVLSGDSYTVNASGLLAVEVPGESGAVLVADGPMDQPPAAPDDLMVTAVTQDSVSLGWSAVTGADSYLVYRSLVGGGGYEWVATTAGTIYTDTGLMVATDYYYVVVAQDDTTGLTSGWSNEVQATPSYDMTAAWYNLQWPPEITHTISAITPTPNIYGQVWIDGATGPGGPAPGLLAEVGYGPTGTTPLTADWMWTQMEYDSAIGNNDQFVATLLPDAVGEYWYITRYSGDGGHTWVYGDLGGPEDITDGIDEPGILHVEASGDATSPDAPTNLEVTGTTPGSVSLAWTQSTAPDTHGYEIYRQHDGGGFAEVGDVAAGTTTFTDFQVQAGETYTYYVLAFDTSFNRSDPSNQVTATAEARLVEVTFRVRVPDYTPDEDLVYIAGSIPDLGPWNPSLRPMTRVEPGIWEITLEILDGTLLEYKYTRGSWDRVESWGSIVGLNNRSVQINYGTDGTQLVDNTATNWGDGPDDEKAVQYWRDPIVVDFYPEAGATAVPTDTVIWVSWSLTMTQGTDFEVAGPDGTVAGTFFQDPATHTTIFTPSASLEPATTYTVVVESETSVGVPGGEGGTQQRPVEWIFTTAPTAPTEVDLALTKTASASTVFNGDILTYTLLVENLGQEDAENVVLTDTLPAGVVFQSASAGCTASAGQVVCDLGTVVGEDALSVTIVVMVGAAGEITNTAQVTTDSAENNTTNNQDSVTVTVATVQFVTYMPLMLNEASPR